MGERILNRLLSAARHNYKVNPSLINAVMEEIIKLFPLGFKLLVQIVNFPSSSQNLLRDNITNLFFFCICTKPAPDSHILNTKTDPWGLGWVLRHSHICFLAQKNYKKISCFLYLLSRKAHITGFFFLPSSKIKRKFKLPQVAIPRFLCQNYYE